ncbi:MAG: 30S ribosomal protein S8 [Bacilli bacterium]|jgi:small subunit ribosomal protein S8|nr:30S ribosomal protein S8 [Bacillota bacterium]NLM31964.1 30S ribosomal protein S8 [Acholeplasmataceae bacterium]HOA77961.1 30S ribosomal protein S8 [Bacilli bacterium]HPZ26727.1 30S ribosomal protein S8 [Bacilli bacterium]HQC89196.1 30S ribosomal protein S8 [Bacilli bacterium]
MVMTDPIADMLTRIRNANQMKHEYVEIPASKLKHEILKVIKREGYIYDVEFIPNDKQGILKVTMKYTDRKERVIKGIKRISKPGLRLYVKANEVPKVLNGLGIAIVSTPKGVMTDREARQQNVGGEVIAFVW